MDKICLHQISCISCRQFHKVFFLINDLQGKAHITGDGATLGQVVLEGIKM